MNHSFKIKRILYLCLMTCAYMNVFSLMEKRDVPIHFVHTIIDEYIPFCRFFIIPYYFWFFYVTGTILWIGIIKPQDEEYKRLIFNLGAGMIMFLIICLIYPNGHHLRPVVPVRDVFSQAVRYLYSIDTPTNILPSLHVYNSVACSIALYRAASKENKKMSRIIVTIISVLIILSTMLLKQHSVVDVILALILSEVTHHFIYRYKPEMDYETVSVSPSV